jgi:hypothetical protein
MRQSMHKRPNQSSAKLHAGIYWSPSPTEDLSSVVMGTFTWEVKDTSKK